MDQKQIALVVEDDSDIQYLYRTKLEREGFTVAVAGNGVEGLMLAEQLRPHILLLDLLMPVMGGSEMLAHLRAKRWGSCLLYTSDAADE